MRLPPLMSVLAVAVLVSGATPARAGDDLGPEVLVIPGSIAIAAGGIAMMVHNGIVGAQGRRPSTGAIVAGHVLGGLNLAAAIPWFLLGLAYTGPDHGGSTNLLVFGIAGAHVAIGGATIGISLWSAGRPRHVMVGPQILTDVAGRPTPGVGISVSGL
jgi:hypothetical protein